MNALKIVKKRTKRERDREKHVLEGAEMVWKTIMVSANERYGFGNVRGGNLVQDSMDLISYLVNRYSGDCAMTALDHMMEERGLKLQIDSK